MFTLNCKGRLVVIDKPIVMGVINATPDSFYVGSRIQGTENIVRAAEKMIREGVDIIDIGGQSTRPGSHQVSEEEELQRVVDAVDRIHSRFPEVIISIDTYFSNVARECVGAGAAMINDISSGAFDEKMLTTVARLKAPYVIMHMRGTPDSMQRYAMYDDVVKEVFDFLVQKKDQCQKAGISDIIIDPGFGFAKTIQHNFRLLKHLSIFRSIEAPLLVGISRKSSIYKTLGVSAGEALNGTTVMNTIALINGAHILRVHDVKEAREAIDLWLMVNSE